MREALHGLALELLGIEAEHGAESPIAVAIAALAVSKSDADWRVLNRVAEQSLNVTGLPLPQQSFHLQPAKVSISAVHRLRPALLNPCCTVRFGDRGCSGLR